GVVGVHVDDLGGPAPGIETLAEPLAERLAIAALAAEEEQGPRFAGRGRRRRREGRCEDPGKGGEIGLQPGPLFGGEGGAVGNFGEDGGHGWGERASVAATKANFGPIAVR